jgi:RimJ/RimL family protein N-acetyltransferase
MIPDSIEIPTLLTERLRLRPFRTSDFEDYAALNSDPRVVRYLAAMPAQTWDRGRSWRHLAFVVGHWQLKGCGTWAVELKETGTFVGTVGFSEPEGWPGFELAWTLVPRHWGNGYATEAARAALDHAFAVWQKDRVISLINPENLRSIRVAERLGESLQDRTDMFGREMLVFGIDREAWRSRGEQESAALRTDEAVPRRQAWFPATSEPV